jgi:hypothetical protein
VLLLPVVRCLFCATSDAGNSSRQMIGKINARFNSLPPLVRFVFVSQLLNISVRELSLDYSHKWPRSQASLTPRAGLVSTELVLVKWLGVIHPIDFRLP